MRAGAVTGGILLALAPAIGAAGPAACGEGAGAAARPGQLAATRTLVARLSASGRGEAAVRATVSDPMGGPDRIQRGRVALEPPDRVRLDFPDSGERIAVRAEGGEWVQPAVRQMVRLSREQAGLAAWLWEVFLRGGQGGYAEREIGPRRFALVARDRSAGLPESLTVTLDPRGLPASVEYREPGGAELRYRFSGWRFVAPRGAAAFVLTAPRGFEVVDLP